jgi:hypothetical protein
MNVNRMARNAMKTAPNHERESNGNRYERSRCTINCGEKANENNDGGKALSGNLPETLQLLDFALRFLDIDTTTGRIFWKVADEGSSKLLKRRSGKPAGHHDARGYLRIGINRTKVGAHRLIWLVATGSLPDGVIDHRDGNPRNNAISNLRVATPSQNTINGKVRATNQTGFTGVSFAKDRNMWRADITLDRKQTCLGFFATPEDAHAARLNAASDLHGEFSRVA